MPDLALDDVKVLDLGTDVPGPYCAKLLADYGAEVIKVELPGGDPARRLGPFPADEPHLEKGGLFLYLNANKRGVTLDFASASGRSLLARLVAWADIVVENNLPSRAAELRLDWPSLRALNQKLVLTSITPFGQTGPSRDYPADETALFALSGRMYTHGLPGREPLRYAPDIVWFQIGSTAAVASMGALFASRRFGIGQQVDLSGLEALAGNVDTRTIFFTMAGNVAQPNAFGVNPAGGVVPCIDGYMLMIAAGERFFRRFLRAIDMEDLIQDPRFATNQVRMEHRDELDAVLLPWFVERTREQVFATLQAHRVMCAPIRTVDEVFGDPQLVERGFFVEVDHPGAGRLTFPGAPFLMSETPWSLRRPAPGLGEHNEEVYCGLLGLSRSDLGILAAGGVI